MQGYEMYPGNRREGVEGIHVLGAFLSRAPSKYYPWLSAPNFRDVRIIEKNWACQPLVIASLLPRHSTLQGKRGPGKGGRLAFGAVLRPFKAAVSTQNTRFMEVRMKNNSSCWM